MSFPTPSFLTVRATGTQQRVKLMVSNKPGEGDKKMRVTITWDKLSCAKLWASLDLSGFDWIIANFNLLEKIWSA